MNKDFSGHLAALLTIFIWGTTFISTKILLTDFKPIEILFFRFLIGLFILILIYPKRLRKTTKKQELTFALTRTLWSYFVLFIRKYCTNIFDGFKYRSDNLNCTVFTAILSHFILKEETLNQNFIIGLWLQWWGLCLLVLMAAVILS